MTVHYPHLNDAQKALCGKLGKNAEVRLTLHYLTCRACLRCLRAKADLECSIARSRWENANRRLEKIDRIIRRENKNRQSSVDTRSRPLP